jgi:protein arginine kinase
MTTESTPAPISMAFFDNPWEKNNNSIWLATTMKLHRNLAKFNFPKHLDGEKRRLVLEMLLEALKNQPYYQDMRIYEVDKLQPTDRDFFSEHFLIFNLPHEGQKEQTFVVGKDGTTTILINSQDHIEFHAVEVSHNLENRFDQLISYEQAIEKELPYAFSNHFGYLTADPYLSGTGLCIQTYLHIPALCFVNKADNYVAPEKIDDILYTSLQGDPEHLIGNLLVLRNRYANGVSEEAIISSMRNTALRIISEEQAARDQILQKKDADVYNAISRALGTILYAYSIDTTEALQVLSMLKFGIELGLVTGMPVESINELFFDCRRGHIVKKINQTAHEKEEVYKIRAQYLKKALHGLALTY